MMEGWREKNLSRSANVMSAVSGEKWVNVGIVVHDKRLVQVVECKPARRKEREVIGHVLSVPIVHSWKGGEKRISAWM
jgi:hypothetical protein